MYLPLLLFLFEILKWSINRLVEEWRSRDMFFLRNTSYIILIIPSRIFATLNDLGVTSSYKQIQEDEGLVTAFDFQGVIRWMHVIWLRSHEWGNDAAKPIFNIKTRSQRAWHSSYLSTWIFVTVIHIKIATKYRNNCLWLRVSATHKYFKLISQDVLPPDLWFQINARNTGCCRRLSVFVHVHAQG